MHEPVNVLQSSAIKGEVKFESLKPILQWKTALVFELRARGSAVECTSSQSITMNTLQWLFWESWGLQHKKTIVFKPITNGLNSLIVFNDTETSSNLVVNELEASN